MYWQAKSTVAEKRATTAQNISIFPALETLLIKKQKSKTNRGTEKFSK